VLHEIRHALAALAQGGAPCSIDLQSMPFADGEQERILATLGEGELRMQLDALGRSEIIETSYPGVWVVTHYDEEGALKARFIEITRVPDIVTSQQADIVEGLARMRHTLSGVLA
jgi:hydrogenase-1 operon protein HyaF